jgi:hypothetical protein
MNFKKITKEQLKHERSLGFSDFRCGACDKLTPNSARWDSSLEDICSICTSCNNRKSVQIIVKDYPCDFTFMCNEALPTYNDDGRGCAKRDEILHRVMEFMNVNSPCHDYTDYVVERVTSEGDAEVWQLGS